MGGLDLFKDFGLLGLVTGVICMLLFMIIKYTLVTTRDILNQAAVERKDWHAKMETINASIIKVCDCLDKHDEKAEERGRYVREEHKEMIEILGRINGYKA